MATQADADRTKATVSFTLPISCQVCLGKVKQPVVCPNLHVFCERCLEVWLKRNNQCPSCRAVIGPENPAKHIIGGQAEEEHPTRQSCPELRRARFDLLYLEYEDQIEQLKKENLILRTENNILVTQVKESDKAKENGRKEHQQASSSSSGGQSSNPEGPSLLMLTRNLQEAQKLYSDIKTDMTRLKQENSKLKDENVALTRENETLRLELAQRSPKKFGRYTVATLEKKVADQEKEIRQLTKALERSDAYIEELQNRYERDGNDRESHVRNEDTERTGTSDRFHINTEPSRQKQQNVETFSFKCDQPLPSDNARRLLFGKVYAEKSPFTNTNKHQNGVRDAVPGSFSSGSKAQEAAVSSTQEVARHASETPQLMPESILKTNPSVMKGVAAHYQDMDTDQGGDAPQSPKRVHFDVPPPPPRTPEEPLSFDLELPSPMDRSKSTPRDSEYLANSNTGLVSSNTQEESLWEDSEFDIKVKDLLRKNAQTLKRSGSLGKASDQYSHSAKKSNKGQQVKTKKSEMALSKNAKRSTSQEVDDSSRLSMPDMSPGNASSDVSGMDDPDQYLQSNHTDLNISMTPELSDCLRLMDRAEKNMVSVGASLPRGNLGSSNGRQHTAGFSASTTGSSTIKGWEQQFYSSLQTNPYKQPQKDSFLPFSLVGKVEPESEGYGGISSGPVSSSLHPSNLGSRENGSYTSMPSSSSTFSFSLASNPLYQAKESKPFITQSSLAGPSAHLHSNTASSGFGASSRSSTALPSRFDLPVSSSTSVASLAARELSSFAPVSSLAPTTFSFASLISQPLASNTESLKFPTSTSSNFHLRSHGKIGRSPALSSHNDNLLLRSDPQLPSLNSSALDWPEETMPGRLSPFSSLQPDLSISDSVGLLQTRAIKKDHEHRSSSLPRLDEPHSRHHYNYHHRDPQHHALTDNSFQVSMEPPMSGYPQELSNETSSTSDLDVCSSPRSETRRRFSFPFASKSIHGGADSMAGLNDFLEKPEEF
ncbi:RING finger protein 219 [Plakobranchus ocellatus]|uniref:RING finger protein 219 n=1 Tax=Plakobranchus ocellatus TaxID=259542 RepID=A0AAV4B5Z0_9GAST|nr:RING finger protein 219 [Plakobranchus ocellatus]